MHFVFIIIASAIIQTTNERPQPQILISLSDLKGLSGEKSEPKIVKYRDEVRRKLDAVSDKEEWEADDVIEYPVDHDYTLPLAIECIGYLCKQVLKRYDACVICREGVCLSPNSSPALSKLVDMKSRGGLIHANSKLFILIHYLETCFAKHSSKVNVFDLTFEDVLTGYKFSFSCEKHGSDILLYTIIYYIRLRMRQNAFQEIMKLKENLS